MSSGSPPSFRYVDDAVVDRLHSAALEVLQDPGIRVMSEECREILAGAGGAITDEDLVSIPPEIVERAIETAPNRFALYDRCGNEALNLGAGNAYFGAGVTCLYFLDPATGERKEYAIPDMEKAARLADALEGIDFIATPGVVRATDEMPIQLANQYEFRAMASNTTKPIMVLIADGPSLEDVYEMAEAIAGSSAELAAKPFVVPYLNTVSPLLMNVETCDKLVISARRGMPVACQAAPQMGATAPITPAGAVVLSAAESLAGLVISQLVREGTPYLSGVVPFAMDMRWANVSTGGPPGLAFQSAMAELCHRKWGLPMVGVGAGAADSKLPDQQKAVESMYYTFGAVLTGVDMMFDAGSFESGLTFSPEGLVLDDEVISLIRGFLEPLDVSDEALSVQSIRDVGPSEHFLSHPQTLEHFRAVWQPKLLSWEARSQWEENGATTMGERARQRAVELIETHEPEPLPDGVMKIFSEVIEARRAAIPEDEY